MSFLRKLWAAGAALIATIVIGIGVAIAIGLATILPIVLGVLACLVVIYLGCLEFFGQDRPKK